MKRILFGEETEFSLSLFRRGKAITNQRDLLHLLLEYAVQRYPGLPGLEGGKFFPAGRLYVDPTGHLETATCECQTPDDLVRVKFGMYRLVQELLEILESEKNIKSVASLTNLDYHGAKWGFHENYGVIRQVAEFEQSMLPFLVTRTIYSGAGGLNPNAPGVRFSLWPTSHYIVNRSGYSNTEERSLFNLKDEPLADQMNRLHVSCGEALCSHFGSWLRTGATALVVLLIDSGHDFGREIGLINPMAARRIIADDVTCRERFKTRNGPLTAGEIQRRYLEQVAAKLPLLPAWAEGVVTAWDMVLTDLENDPAGLSFMLDWPLKRQLFQDMTQARHGIAWHEIEGLGLDDPLLKSIRNDLIEADVLFSQPGVGYFAQLETLGQLRHRLPSVSEEAVRLSVAYPNTGGRADGRAKFLRENAVGGTYEVGWMRVVDNQNSAYMQWNDPFSGAAAWEKDEFALPISLLDDDDDDLLDWDFEEPHETEAAQAAAELQALIDSLSGQTRTALEEASEPAAPVEEPLPSSWAQVERLHEQGKEKESNDDTFAAETCYRKACEMAHRIGYSQMETHCRWHLAMLQKERGDMETARETVQPILARRDDDPEEGLGVHLQMALLIEMQAALLAEDLSAVQTAYARAMRLSTTHSAQLAPRFRQIAEEAEHSLGPRFS